MDIHRADKAYRNRAVLLLAGVSLLCIVLLWQLNAFLTRVNQELLASDPDTVRQWLRILLTTVGGGLALPAAALGMSLRRLAWSSRLEGRFPPREWKTWRDVRVLRDAPALIWARRVEAASTLALVLSAGLVAWAAFAWWRFG